MSYPSNLPQQFHLQPAILKYFFKEILLKLFHSPLNDCSLTFTNIDDDWNPFLTVIKSDTEGFLNFPTTLSGDATSSTTMRSCPGRMQILDSPRDLIMLVRLVNGPITDDGTYLLARKRRS
ncbi:hypothetical protein AVEN_12736-1 [Araneus ventricosus]|uniref:Uncharacterized protein n=1 Tax=Araneus ventricosus TaxID=182803 RepID=A0A4Y2AB67_ARAVE|nr:hypothetical protein AVEN_12736-1 [Araneus ventricosus]